MTELFSGARIPVNKSITARMDNVIAYHKVNVILGAVGCIINLILLSIFLASPTLRKKCEIPIVLCLADCINTFSVMLMGINRVHMYTEIVETLSIPVPTAWECALQPWLIFRGFGALWSPTVQVAMGIDRCVAVFNPFHYNKKPTTWWADSRLNEVVINRGRVFIATFIPATCMVAVGQVIAWVNRRKNVKYVCGRKATYGNIYASFLYTMNIAGYVVTFVLITISYIKSRYWMETRAGQAQQAKIRYQLIISLLSIILVSIPNGISLYLQHAKVPDAIAKTSTYLLCVNSSIDIFVYFALYREFRQEFRKCILQIVWPVKESTTVTTVNVLPS